MELRGLQKQTVQTDAPAKWICSENEEEKCGRRPEARLYGYNVHFNLLYDMGANPTIQYATDKTEYIADSREELYDMALNGKTPSPEMLPMLDRSISQLEDGSFRYCRISKISILGWDPNELHFEDAE